MAKRGPKPLYEVPSHVVPDAPEYVYFVRDPASGLVKIGTTYGPRLMTRVREHERAVGHKVELLAAFPGGRSHERSVHDALRDSRERGEWFRPSPQMAELIRSTNASYALAAATAYWGEWLSAGLL